MEHAMQRYPAGTSQTPGSWPLSQSAPQNTSALRSTVEPSRTAPRDESEAHSFGASAAGPAYPSSTTRFLTPGGRWMNPTLIRPIDSAYLPSTTQQQPNTLLPSPFPQYQNYLAPLNQDQASGVLNSDYYNPTPPSSASSSTSPSSMSSRSIETLDSPITFQHAASSQNARYQHQHHHSDPYIYSNPQAGYATDDPYNRSNGGMYAQQSYIPPSTSSYAPFVVPLGSDMYGTHQKPQQPPTIDSFNSAVMTASSSSTSSSSRRKLHRPSFSAGNSDDLYLFSQTTTGTPRSVHRSKPGSPASSRMQSVSPYARRSTVSTPSAGQRSGTLGLDLPFLLLDLPGASSSSVAGPSSSVESFHSSHSHAHPVPRAPKPSVDHPFRTFPEHVQIDPQFPLLYRKFYVSSYFAPGDSLGNHVFAENPDARPYPLQRLAFNMPAHPMDLYTPRYVKGSGSDKVGLCPICIEPISRGGEGNKLFLKTKVSAYNYHMQYYHGICARSNMPFSPPLESRITARPRASIKERKEIKEGLCHSCQQWIPLQGTKDVEVMVKEIFWWKHAAQCHKGSNVEGEGDFFVEDDVIYRRVQEYESRRSVLVRE